MTARLDHLGKVEISSAAELRAWLAAHHTGADSVWLVTHRKSAGQTHVPYARVVEELLCYGWIDSLPRALDDGRTMVLISPRKPGSNWSKDNRERIERLARQGRLAPAGAAVVAAARKDGSWDRLRPTESGIAPADLAEALAAGDAARGWEGLSLSVRRRSLEYLLAAKRPETRARRIAAIVAAAGAGEDPTIWRPKA